MRIATFNLETFGGRPERAELVAARIAAMRPLIERLEADVLCLQELGAENHGRLRSFDSLERLLAGTRYARYQRVATTNDAGTKPRDVHNLVILSRFPVLAWRQLLHDLVPPPAVRRVTAEPAETAPIEVRWDRPVLHATLELPSGRALEVVNLHLRAPLAAPVPGQKSGPLSWRTVPGWAEGMYLAAIKRAGQAFEARRVVDELLDRDPEALIVACGDFNADGRQAAYVILRADAGDTGTPELARRSLFPLDLRVPRPQRFSVRHGGAPLMLDHLMASHALIAHFRDAVIDNAALEDELIAPLVGREPLGSFHAPVVAIFDRALLDARR